MASKEGAIESGLPAAVQRKAFQSNNKRRKKFAIGRSPLLVGGGAKVGVFAIMILQAVVVLLPLLWLLSSSLKTQQDLAANIWGPPQKLVFQNYMEAWTSSNIGRYMVNSLTQAAVTIGLTVVTSATLAYVLARFQFRLNRAIYYLVIAGMMIPVHSAVIPLYIMGLKLGLQDNLVALGAIYAAFRIPVSVFILEAFMVGIPRELEECAIIDGASYQIVFFRIIVPLSRDGIVTIMVLAAVACWNELLVSMLMLHQPEIKTLPIGILGFLTEYDSEYTILCAAIIVALIPTLLFYIFMQERIQKGMTIGAIKG